MNPHLITLPANARALRARGVFAGPGRPGPIDLPASIPAHDRRGVFNRAHGRRFDVQAAGEDCTTLMVYDEIGEWGISAAAMRVKLSQITTPRIRLEINSPGGDVFDGIAIFNDLVRHKARVEVVVTGVAASAASIIAMAGDDIGMYGNAFLMIHNAWSVTIGDQSDHAAMAQVLAKIDEALARTYARRAGTAADMVEDLMAAETWMDAEQAVDRGFADRVLEDEAGPDARAAFDLSVFNKTPRELARFAGPADDPTCRDIERALRDAGVSRSKAKALASARTPSPDPDQRDADAPELGSLLAFVESEVRKITNPS